MSSFKVCVSLILLFLTSCTSTFERNSEETTAQSRVTVDPTPTPSQSASATPSIGADRSVVNFNKIDSTLMAQGSKFNIQSRTESSSNCRHVMQYPQVSGLADTALQTELNQALRQNMIEQMGVTGDLLEGDRCPRASLRDAQNRPRPYTWSSCKTHFAANRLVSIACLTLSLPGAYPHPEILPVTFDLKTGKIYQLAELFKPDSNYPVRLAISMRDAWWETIPGYISFPFSSFEADPSYQVEAGPYFRFYFQEQCDVAFQYHWEDARVKISSSPPEVCMVIPNLGGGASRNYRMPVRMGALEEILDTSGALNVLAERIDDR